MEVLAAPGGTQPGEMLVPHPSVRPAASPSVRLRARMVTLVRPPPSSPEQKRRCVLHLEYSNAVSLFLVSLFLVGSLGEHGRVPLEDPPVYSWRTRGQLPPGRALPRPGRL